MYLIEISENIISEIAIIKIKILYFLNFILFFALIIKKPHINVISGKKNGLKILLNNSLLISGCSFFSHIK